MKNLSVAIAFAVTLTVCWISNMGDAHACVAQGHPRVTIKLQGKNTGLAVISEYDCAAMVAKTFCICGIRLSEKASTAGINITDLRFVNTDDYSTVEGFNTKLNKVTAKAFSRFMGGTWTGFAGLYNAKINKHGGTAMEVKFTYREGTNPQVIAEAFDHGHVGIGEGIPSGDIAPRGHHIEVIEIRGAAVAENEPAKAKAK